LIPADLLIFDGEIIPAYGEDVSVKDWGRAVAAKSGENPALSRNGGPL
jgi:hypothetical protein